jgi:hypothetical protein
MYQPYPTSGQMPERGQPPVPPPVESAIKAMYAGAAATLVGVVIEILTVNSTRAALERRSRHLTTSQLNANEHVLIIGFVVTGLIAVAAWIAIARACRNGSNGARITGTVLFGLHTLGFLGVLSNAHAGLGPVKVLTVIGWLIACGATVFLWQRPSSAFFTRTALPR